MATDRPLWPAITALLLLTTLVLASAPLVPSAHANAVVATVSVGSYPLGVAYDSSKGEVFVANNGRYNVPDNTVSVISDQVNTTTSDLTLYLVAGAAVVAVGIFVGFVVVRRRR